MENEILDCGHKPSPHEAFTTGYGIDKDGKKACYECCAKFDRENMARDKKYFLYLSKKGDRWTVSNWPGSLVCPVNYVRESRNNWGYIRRDFWFTFEGKTWHGVLIGNNNQLARVRQTKGK